MIRRSKRIQPKAMHHTIHKIQKATTRLNTSKVPISRLFHMTGGRMDQKRISLTPAEKLFRKCLLDCRATMSAEPAMKDLVLRWTGGWVRDKLLGVQSNDIDVALSTMTGQQFGNALQDFMKGNGNRYEEEAVQQGFKADLGGLHKIAANPDKSKHLETITTKMFGIDVDFVNLRKEVYADDSRNPQMEFGTAQEDALRRDATVNALFYNLDSELVEDFTTRGLNDMRDKIIRTPLEPYQTFKDDPLRVLRLIRFACRLGYEIEKSAQMAMMDKSIHTALRDKISRERVGVELGKIFAGPDPYTGLSYINQFNLYSTVFANPVPQAECPDPATAQAAYDGFKRVLEEQETICVALKPKEDQATSWFLAAYVPWFGPSSDAVKAARDGIKATNSMSHILKEAINCRPNIAAAVNLVAAGQASRGQIGMILRESKSDWRQHVLYALLCELTTSDFPEVADKYENFVKFLHSHNLSDAWSIDKQLVLKGNEIKTVLEMEKQGPWIKKAVDMVAEWQFDQNGAETKEKATDMIRGRKAELGLK